MIRSAAPNPSRPRLRRWSRLALALAAFSGLLGLVTVAGVPAGAAPTITGVTAGDLAHSASATRLVDGVLGEGADRSWANAGNPWSAASYPMEAVLDLGAVHELESFRYYAGQIPFPARARLEVATSETGAAGSFQAVAPVTAPSYQTWSAPAALDGRRARYVSVRFSSLEARFNLAELAFTGTPVGTGGGGTGGGGTGGGGTGGGGTGASGNLDAQPRSAPPGSGVTLSHGFGTWPNAHLSAACRQRHDSYWVQGPEANPALPADHPQNRAYHTWHPAVDTTSGGTRCDYGHEHGPNPRLAPAPVFELAGGWPAFGFAVESAGGHRHEDHVGHKVTVAHYRASIGNSVGPDTLYDAGFECDWLSKIHQGSHSLDAFSNHLHEYYLTVICTDGRNSQGRVDNTVIGTRFSVKVIYTYGEAGKFVEDGCTSDNPATPQNETVFPATVLTGPEGQPMPAAQQQTPVGLGQPNNREFTCSSPLLWKDLATQVPSMNLWTELIEIQGANQRTVLTIQPYYIVKNSARIIEGYDGRAGERPSQIRRTIDLCYGPTGARLAYPLCADAPNSRPADWRSPASPFNGTLRAVHFKALGLYNAGGVASFCTDAFGRTVTDAPPCAAGHILQHAAAIDNDHNTGHYSYGGRTGNVQGSIWNTDARGRRRSALPLGAGAYQAYGIGFELIVDNRRPDDNGDGVADGASIRGQN